MTGRIIYNKKTNSKELWQVSATGLVIGCLIAAVSFYLKVHDMAPEAVPVLAVVGIMVSDFQQRKSSLLAPKKKKKLRCNAVYIGVHRIVFSRNGGNAVGGHV